MTRRKISISLELKPPTLLDRIWYRSINQMPPTATASSGPRHSRWARLVPYRFRRFHHAYATRNRFYWLPCPLCGWEYGGHEAGKTIPDPSRGPGCGMAICSKCSRKRRGEER